MIISISGPQHTGKTVLFNELRRTLPPLFSNVSFLFIEEDARIIWEEIKGDYTSLREYISANGFLSWQQKVCERTIKTLSNVYDLLHRVKNPTVAIFDRSVIDCIVYLHLYSETISSDTFKQLINDCIAYSSYIDYHFFTVPTTLTLPKTDELRSFFMDTYKHEVVLFSLFHSLGEVLPTPLNARIDTIHRWLDHRMSRPKTSSSQISRDVIPHFSY